MADIWETIRQLENNGQIQAARELRALAPPKDPEGELVNTIATLRKQGLNDDADLLAKQLPKEVQKWTVGEIPPIVAWKSGWAETLPEFQAMMGETPVAESPSGRRGFLNPRTGQWQYVAAPGINEESIAEFAAGNALPIAGSIAGVALAPATAGALAVGGLSALGSMGGKALEEAGEGLLGVQRESPMQVAGGLLATGAPDLLIPGAMRGAQVARDMMYRGSGRAAAAQSMVDTVNFLRNDPQFGSMMPQPSGAPLMEQVGLGGIPGPVLRPAMYQADMVSGALSDAAEQSQLAGAEALKMLTGNTGPIPRHVVQQGRNEALKNAAQRNEEALAAEVRRIYPTRSQASVAANREAGETIKQYHKEVSAAYDDLDRFAERQYLQFDFAPLQGRYAREAATDPALIRTEMVDSGFLDSSGRPIMTAVQNRIDTLDAPGKVNFVKRLIASIDPVQTEYGAIKNLRSQVGKIIKDWPYEQTDSKLARGVWKDLTEILQNPSAGLDVAGYQSKFSNASKMAKHEYDLREDAGVRRVFQGQGRADLITQFANSPGGFLSPEFKDFVSRMRPDVQDTVREGVQSVFLDSKNPVAAYDAMKRASIGIGNTEESRFLFKNAAQEAAFLQNGERVAQFWNSPLGKAAEGAQQELGAIEQLVWKMRDEGVRPERARGYIEQFYPKLTPAEQGMWRQSVMDDVVSKVLTGETRNGELVINAKELRTQIRRLQAEGSWDLLDERMRQVLPHLEKYVRRFGKLTGDAGSSMQNAAMVANLKGMLTGQFNQAFEGAHTLMQSRMFSKFVTNPARFEKIEKRLKEAGFKRNRPIITALLAYDTVAEITQENAKTVQDAMNKLEQGGPGNTTRWTPGISPVDSMVSP